MRATASTSAHSSTITNPVGTLDLEMNRAESASLFNDAVSNLAWQHLNVFVKDRKTGSPLTILNNSSGIVHAGQMLAIMGPSGSGKTTLLNALAHRVASAGATIEGDILVNSTKTSLHLVRALSRYVEQEDALLGSLTVRETMIFAARLSLPSRITKTEALKRVDNLIASFGLQSQSHTIVGTPMRKGLSGGQKKRLNVASRLVTNPKIIFLDEPTSGLDSALSREVCSYIKSIGKKHNLVVIASIHQPSSLTFQQFDTLCLLSGGLTCYFGPVPNATAYFGRIEYPIPSHTNPAEFFLDLINTDLDKDGEIQRRTDGLCQAWTASKEMNQLQRLLKELKETGEVTGLSHFKADRPRSWMVLVVLLHRLWIKSYRDIMAYGIRIAMYLGLAILMGTVFLRFTAEQQYVQPYVNAIFFGSAFMSFMAVAYVPAFLEDLSTFHQERANGLVGPLAFMTSNFIIGLPFLFIIALFFSIVAYWLIGFRADGSAFVWFLLWLFLDLVAAESLVVLVSSVFNVFVVALAITAFANGLWMCVGGFLVPMNILNSFWKYVFHYIDYQAYVFRGMMVNELQYRTYKCATAGNNEYQCSYPSDQNSEGIFRGTDVLSQFSISTGLQGTWVGIMIGIIAGYRILAYVALVMRK